MARLAIELRQLRYFAAVAEELHFSRAATRLFIAQPALSQAIRALETSLGCSLLVRNSRNVELTAAGRALHERLTEILPGLDRAMAEAYAVAGGKSSLLTLGFLRHSGRVVTRDLISRFESVVPDVELRLKTVSLRDQTLAIARGDVDVTVVRMPVADPAVELLLLATEPRAVAVSRSHRLADRGSLTMQDLEGEVVLRLIAGPVGVHDSAGYEAILDDTATRYGPTVETLDEALEHVAHDHGVHVTLLTAEQWSGNPGVVFIPLLDAPASQTALAWRAGPRSAALDTLIHVAETLRSVDDVNESRAAEEG